MFHIPKSILSLLLVATMVSFSACSVPIIAEQGSTSSSKISIVTTLFPQYDFAKQIAGEFADVTLLLPPGVEPHSYEPTPKDMTSIQNASLFIYTSEIMEPWVKKMTSSLSIDHVTILEAAKNIVLLEGHDEHEGEVHEGEITEADNQPADEHSAYDPHVWTDPQNALIMVDNITAALSTADPSHSADYAANATAYKEELKALDLKIKTSLDKVPDKDIVYGGHSALTYFANRYQLHIHTAYESMSPDAEPTSKKVAELIDYVKANKVQAIFYEELVNPRIAEVVSNETGAEMLLLHGAHNISADEIKANVTYIQIMEGNLKSLKKGLKIND